MIARNGEVIAIDSVSASMPLSGNGLPWSPLGISEGGMKTISAVDPLFVRETENNIVFGVANSVKPVYFTGTVGRNTKNKYFSLNGNVLSASPEVEYFNLALNYDVNVADGACPDFIYEASVSLSNRTRPVHKETHHIDGIKGSESYSTNLILKNNSPFTVNFAQDQGLTPTTVSLSCLGFVTSKHSSEIEQVYDETVSGYKLVGWDPVINIVGGNEPDEYIDFGDNKVLEV